MSTSSPEEQDVDGDFQKTADEELLEGVDVNNVDKILEKDLQGLHAVIFKILMKQTLTLGETKALAQCLLPRKNISEDYIVLIIASLSRKDKNVEMTVEMLKWAISVFDMISTKTKIQKLYMVLFHSLCQESVRAPVCHLLYYITKREHVTPYRVRRLTELIQNEKSSAEMIGLLMVYQTYDVTITVPHNVRLVNTFVFKTPFPDLKNRSINIRRLWNVEYDESIEPRKAEFQLPTKAKSKKFKSKVILEEPVRELSELDITLIANDVERLDLSEQLSTILEDRRLQHALLCKRDDAVIDRVSHWLVQKVMNLALWTNEQDVMKTELHEMLRKLVKFTRFTKSQLPVIEYFLFEYLKTWNGFEFEDEIFELITYIKPANYKDFYNLVLMRLYRLFVVSDAKWKAKLILCYTDLLNNWALLNWNRHAKLSEQGESSIDHVTTAFGVLSFDVNYFNTIQKLVEHVDRMCVMGLLAEDDHPLLQHAGLTFFELVSKISVQDNIPDVIIPAATFVHRNFYSPSAMAVSRVCGILYQYKIAFEENDKKTEDWMSKHTPEYLNHFNTYLMDVCNSLWKNIGLSKVKDEANAFSLTRQSGSESPADISFLYY
ncbi:hypothetical protein [Parasitella parasitica]|uniref:Centromere protein I n=1 Tax=Parasitella parasitica TaxID=35722 RepID=A0A0B7MZ26_9FUNG|nr:hypothetical protein [Parasitella parasitica]